jgi:hypothetical protein
MNSLVDGGQYMPNFIPMKMPGYTTGQYFPKGWEKTGRTGGRDQGSGIRDQGSGIRER